MPGVFKPPGQDLFHRGKFPSLQRSKSRGTGAKRQMRLRRTDLRRGRAESDVRDTVSVPRLRPAVVCIGNVSISN